jgi:DUF4097 and DUF4098 domain-containing protein YvlB
MVHTSSSTARPTRRSVLAAGGAGLALSLSGCLSFGDVTAASEERLTLPVEGASTLAVVTTNGDVTVAGWDGDRVELTVTGRARASAALERATVETSVVDGVLTLRTVDRSRGTEERPSVSLAVRVPRALPVASLETTNGRIEASDVVGDLRAASRNGDVRVRQVAGYVDLATQNGDVEAVGCTGLDGARVANGNVDVEVAALRRDATVDTDNGTVVVRLAPDLSADYRAATSLGVVRVVDLAATDRLDERRAASGRLGTGGHVLTARAATGDVELRPR